MVAPPPLSLSLFQQSTENVKLSIFGHKHTNENTFLIHLTGRHPACMNDVYLKRLGCLGVAQVRERSRHKIIKKFSLMIHHRKQGGSAHLLTRIPPTSLDDIHEQSGNKYLS